MLVQTYEPKISSENPYFPPLTCTVTHPTEKIKGQGRGLQVSAHVHAAPQTLG